MTSARVARAFFGAAIFTVLGAGCSLIISGDVPDFACASASATACPSGMVCDLRAARCVAGIESGLIEDSGPTEDVDQPDAADAKDGDATASGELGKDCRIDGDCKSKLCGTSTQLTTVITGATGPICTTPCCASPECPAGFVCFDGGTGGAYCVPAALAQRAAPGVKQAGAVCAANTECRSGLCQTRCLDTCCSQNDCATGSVCRVKTVSLLTAAAPTHDVWVCAAAQAGASGDPGDSCGTNGACKSDVCIPGVIGLCRPPCSSTAACRTLPSFTSGHCLYGQTGADYFKFCFATTTGTDFAVGVACTDDSECQSDYCDSETKRCADLCARDVDCPGQVCRPSAGGTPFLRCVAK